MTSLHLFSSHLPTDLVLSILERAPTLCLKGPNQKRMATKQKKSRDTVNGQATPVPMMHFRNFNFLPSSRITSFGPTKRAWLERMSTPTWAGLVFLAFQGKCFLALAVPNPSKHQLWTGVWNSFFSAKMSILIHSPRFLSH